MDCFILIHKKSTSHIDKVKNISQRSKNNQKISLASSIGQSEKRSETMSGTLLIPPFPSVLPLQEWCMIVCVGMCAIMFSYIQISLFTGSIIVNSPTFQNL